jgi:hypothetical protein
MAAKKTFLTAFVLLLGGYIPISAQTVRSHTDLSTSKQEKNTVYLPTDSSAIAPIQSSSIQELYNAQKGQPGILLNHSDSNATNKSSTPLNSSRMERTVLPKESDKEKN